MSHDVFVSYSSKDKAVADAVVSALENSGLRCWVAPRDVKPGADWGDSITSAISACKLVILVFSGHSNQSKHVRDEIYYAISEESIILPFRIENLDPTGSMRLHLSSRHWLDAFQPSWQDHLNRLVSSAADSLGRELVQPAAKEQAPEPAVAAPKASGKQPPWLWIGLAAGAVAVLGAAGLLWSDSRDRQAAGPTDAPAVQRASGTATALSVTTPSATVKTLVVTSAEDTGQGTLRQTIFNAETGDTIVFDPAAFPPENPTVILLRGGLPAVRQGYLTIDGSDSGVILDGSQAGGEWTPGIELASSHNVIQGLQALHFTGPGILIDPEADFNTIGGDRHIGAGPLGQGNLFSDTSDGVAIMGSDNVVVGNLIGTDVTGTVDMGNMGPGIFLEDNANRNVIGPENVIAYNGKVGGGGVEIRSVVVVGNTIRANSIHGNSGPGILYNTNNSAPPTYSTPPVILYFDLASGTANGQTCGGCVVEVFSTDTQDGKTYEGTVTADDFGQFSLRTGKAFTGPFLTATSIRPGLNTSEFSPPTASMSDVQIALDAIQNESPVYQTSFDTWPSGDLMENARVENGKLILTSENQEHVAASPGHLTSDKYAVEFELRFWEASPEGHCVFETSNDGSDDPWKAMSYIFFSSGQMLLTRFAHSEQQEEIAEDIAASRYDETRTTTAMLIVLGDQVTAFLNGQVAFTALDPDLSVDYTHQSLAATQTIVCEFDNFRLWDLRGVDFNP